MSKQDSPKFFNSPKLSAFSPRLQAQSPRLQAQSPRFGPVSGSDKFVSTGRGGAGNIGAISKDFDLSSPRLTPHEENDQHIHNLNSQKVFTTGRGGAGNMQTSSPSVSLSDAEIKTQQIQEAPLNPTNSNTNSGGNALEPTYSGSIGRGGFGNVKATKNARSQDKKSILDRMKDSLKHH